ncbi:MULTISPECIES: hypothetical protein [unclassified Nonomuraea]
MTEAMARKAPWRRPAVTRSAGVFLEAPGPVRRVAAGSAVP